MVRYSCCFSCLGKLGGESSLWHLILLYPMLTWYRMQHAIDVSYLPVGSSFTVSTAPRYYDPDERSWIPKSRRSTV